jgi:type III restriction enzyme
VPGVNNLGSHGRWAFAEFTAVYEMEDEFAALIAGLTQPEAERV